MRGCDKPLPEYSVYEFDSIKIDRCPCFYLKDDVFISQALEFYNWREKGILPYGGGYFNQPNKYIEICSYIGYLIGEKTDAERKKISDRTSFK